MKEYLTKLLSFLDGASRMHLSLLLVLMLVGAVLELVGISMVLPILTLAVAPDQLSDIPLLGELPSHFSLEDPRFQIVLFAVILFILFLLKNGLMAVIIWFQGRFAWITLARLGTQMMDAYLRRSYSRHLRQNSSIVLRNLTISLPSLCDHGILSVLTLIMEAVATSAVMGVLVFFEPRAALLALGLVGCSMGSSVWAVRHRVSDWGRHVQTLRGRLIRAINENLDAFKEIKLRGARAIFVGRFADPAMAAVGYDTRLSWIAQVPRLIGEVAIIGAVVAITVLIVLVENRPLLEIVPTLGIFAVASIRILPSVNRIAVALTMIRRSLPVVNELYHEFHYPEFAGEPEPSRGSIKLMREIRIENVSFRYEGTEKPALSNISLDIGKGEKVAFVGSSGAGKSSLADLILGLHAPDAGSILVDGIDIQEDLRSWQDGIGYVPQHVVIADRSLRQNVAFADPDHAIQDERLASAIRVAQLGTVIDELQQGIDTPLGENGVRLSGGQRQRIGIARALYSDPISSFSMKPRRPWTT